MEKLQGPEWVATGYRLAYTEWPVFSSVRPYTKSASRWPHVRLRDPARDSGRGIGHRPTTTAPTRTTVRTGGPFRTERRTTPTGIHYVSAGTSLVSAAATGIAPSMITEAVFAASCNDFDDR
jgi:hypothetical protein